MPFEVSIKITAESQLEAVESAEQAMQRLGQASAQSNQQIAQVSQRAGEQAARGYDALTSAGGKAAVSTRQLGSAVGIVASQVGGLGPVANLASNAIITMTLVSGPAGIGLAALAATVGLVVHRFQQARDAAEELAERGLAAIGREIKAVQLDQEIRQRVKLLQSVIPEITEVRQQFDRLRIEAGKVGADPATFARIATAENLAIAKVMEGAREAINRQIESVRAQQKELNEGAEAAALYRIANLSSADAVRILGKEGQTLLGILREETLALIASNQELAQRAALAKQIAESGAALDKQLADENAQLEKQLQIRARLGNLDLEKLRAAGAPEAQILREKIRLIGEEREALERSPVAKEPGQIAELIKQEEIAEIQLRRLQATSIDVAGEVARAVTDITGAVISGTLKWADVGRSVLASFVRVAMEQFTNFLRGMQQQAQSAAVLSAGGAAIPGGGATAGGGFLSSIFSGIGSLLPSGAGGFGLGNLLGGLFGGFGGIGGGIGGALGGMLGSFVSGIPMIGIGGTIAGTIGSGLGATLSGALGSTLGGLIGNFALPGIGMLLGGFLGGGIGSLFGTPRSATSQQRRAAHIQAAEGIVKKWGYHLLEGEQQLIQQAALNIAGVAELRSRIQDVSIGAILSFIQHLAIHGSRASAGIPQFAAELVRRGITPPTMRAPLTGWAEFFGAPGMAEKLEGREQRERELKEWTTRLADQGRELLGRGLMAALEAVSESAAQENFLRTIGEGTRQAIFSGITNAFMASAQFEDLFKPLGETIRQFAQEAIRAERQPDLAAFRRAVLPQIEDITTRAELLAPLVAELQKSGLDVTKALEKLLGVGQARTLGPISITINGNITGEEDMIELTRRIGEIINTQLPPPV